MGAPVVVTGTAKLVTPTVVLMLFFVRNESMMLANSDCRELLPAIAVMFCLILWIVGSCALIAIVICTLPADDADRRRPPAVLAVMLGMDTWLT